MTGQAFNTLLSVSNTIGKVGIGSNVPAKLEGAIYDENAGVTRFVLCALAQQSMTKETWVDLWKFESKQFVWTIEHIFPQGGNIPALRLG